MTRYWVLALVTPSSATNSGSVRDAFDLVTRNWVLALVTPSSATNSGSVRDVHPIGARFSDKKLCFGIGNAIESH